MIKIFVDKDTKQSVMIDDVKEYAFGPVFGTDEDPQDFLDWCENSKEWGQWLNVKNIRYHEEKTLVFLVDKWRKEEETENEARAERVYSDTAATTLSEQMENARKLK